MVNRSSKVTEFLKNNPVFEKHYKEIYSSARNADLKAFSGMSPEAKSKLEKKFGSKLNLKNIQTAIEITKKLNSDEEFLAWISGDKDNIPAIQLNNAELAIVRGGGLFGALASAYFVYTNPTIDNAVGCAKATAR